MLEQLAEGVMSQWLPLRVLGSEANANNFSQLDEGAGVSVDFWTALGCLPKHAPMPSEAATVVATEMAAAASKAAIEAAEQKTGGWRRRKRNEPRGLFSSSAQGPWSGTGKHASPSREDRALFRTLCVSATDPPSVIVATPRGIQEIVPSSYASMPAGFRLHHKSKRMKDGEGKHERLEALEKDRNRELTESAPDDDDSFLSSFDGGPAVLVDEKQCGDTRWRRQRWRRIRFDEGSLLGERMGLLDCGTLQIPFHWLRSGMIVSGV
ncbi:hypothetical protein FGB62_359g04 [Gracilaria domingensis]|nr:hypothetical protein FGB62_359g04 [Gracilaria domingensis]